MSSGQGAYPEHTTVMARYARRDFMRRALGLGLSVSAASGLLAACGGAPATTAITATSSTATQPATTTAVSAVGTSTTGVASSFRASPVGSPTGDYPLTQDKVTFKVLVLANPTVEDFSTNAFTKWYEAKTNVRIDWQVVPSTDSQNKLNVTLASGDYPDIIMSFGVNPALQLLYGAQGVFLPLNELIDRYGVSTKKVFADYPIAKDSITATDGKIYALPQLNDCYHCSMPQKMWLYQPWLDKLGLKMPTTTDDFAQVLTAFKTKDPNGNGKADEIPLTSAKDNQGNSNLDLFLMNAFIFDPGGDRLIVRDGKVTPIYTQPEWQNGLRYLHRLYQDGLIAPESFTQDNTQLKRLGNNPNAVIVGTAPVLAISTFVDLTSGAGRWSEYVTVPPLKGPQGAQFTTYSPYAAVGQGSYIITKACKQPDVAFRWADGMYERETTLRSVFGIKDTDWRYANPGEIGINGQPAIWRRLNIFGKVQNNGWAQTGPSYRSNDLRLGEAIDQSVPQQEVILYKETKEKYEPHKEDLKLLLPPLFFTADQSQQIADQGTTIAGYWQQAFAQFITGNQDVERDWKNYLSTLNGMGLEQLLQTYQIAYDAKVKR